MGKGKRQSGGNRGKNRKPSVVDLAKPGLETQEGCSPEEIVFAQDMLRELIIDYAIRNQAGVLCGRNIGVVRRLQKCWQVSVSKVLAKNHEPLYNLTLNKDNSLKSSQVVKNDGKLLDQFVKLVNSRIEPPFPTFRVQILEEFFQLENYDSFYTFLVQCGQGLVELKLLVPNNGGYLPCIFSNVNFPSLWKLTATFTNKELLPSSVEPSGGPANVMLLLQTFLNKNGSLNELVLPYESTVIPNGLQYLCLPKTVTKLDLYCVLNNRQLEMLSRNPLSNLTRLGLLITKRDNLAGMISQLLQKLKKTLRHLFFDGEVYTGSQDAVSFVTFPVMEKLQSLAIDCIHLELESDLRGFDTVFPKLTSWTHLYQTRRMFHKWTCDLDAPASNVTTVELQLVEMNFSDLSTMMPILLEDMQRVHSKFPNVTCLTLGLTTEQICGIQYVFTEMRQLTSLTFSDLNLTRNPTQWDSILTGVPEEIVAGMRARPDFLQFMEFKHEAVPSIRMLTELKTLRLKCQDQEELSTDIPVLISDVTFKFGLMKMEALKDLQFHGPFVPSEESTEAWKKLGRTITYSKD